MCDIGKTIMSALLLEELNVIRNTFEGCKWDNRLDAIGNIRKLIGIWVMVVLRVENAMNSDKRYRVKAGVNE